MVIYYILYINSFGKGIGSMKKRMVMLSALVLYGTVSSGNSAKIYADNGSTGFWAKDSVYAMQQGGILQGKSGSKFCPKDGCTIEQALVTMLRMTQRRNQGGKSCVL